MKGSNKCFSVSFAYICTSTGVLRPSCLRMYRQWEVDSYYWHPIKILRCWMPRNCIFCSSLQDIEMYIDNCGTINVCIWRNYKNQQQRLEPLLRSPLSSPRDLHKEDPEREQHINRFYNIGHIRTCMYIDSIALNVRIYIYKVCI